MLVKRRGFTLIELLVVIAIISILVAILFPVFSSAREKGRATSCLSNENQLGLAVQQYLQDYDDRMFFRSGWNYSRSTTVAAGKIPTTNYNRWWNMIMPYIKNNSVFTCPSDKGPTLSPDVNGINDIPRSYIAVSTAESLTLAQGDDPVETIVITEKWNTHTDSWLEPFNGDFQPDNSQPGSGLTWTAANRHTGLANCVFFDGHAKAMQPADIINSKELTGCDLVYLYPFTNYDANTPTVTSASSQATNPYEPNDCANPAFTYP